MNEQEPGLKKKVISGFMWQGSLTFLGQAITWAITLVLRYRTFVLAYTPI